MTLTLAELCNIIRLQLGIHHVQPQDYLFAELHAESLDIVIILSKLEEQYGIHIPESELTGIETVTDFYDLTQQEP